MERRSFAVGGLLSGFLVLCWACSSDTAAPANTMTSGGGMAGLGGNTAGTQAIAGAGTGGATAGAAGNAAGTSGGGSGGAAGGAGGAAAGAAGTPVAGAGGTSGGGAGGAGGASGASGAAGAGGAGVTASCAEHPEYDLCVDFEGPIPAAWAGGNDNAVVTTDFAHGGHSYQLYKCNDATAPTEASKCADSMSGGKFTITDLGAISNQIWGRFYVHFSPGAPGGHGNIVGAFEGGAWYEIGWQFDGIMGVWHNGGENPIRSMPYIVDQWYCVELLFDGAAAAMPKWYIDGMEAGYYKDEPNNPTQPITITAFDKIEVGFTPYAGLEIRQPDGVGDQTEMRMLNGMWIDDIAFDTERIGCIAGPVGQ